MTQVRDLPHKEEMKRESDVDEENDDEIDYQRVAWAGTFPGTPGKVATVFLKGGHINERLVST